MPQPLKAPETFNDMVFPTRGIDLAQGYGQQLPGTTPVGQNVRVYEPLTLRGRGGSRPGISKYVAQQVPGIASLIQHLNIIVDPSTAATLDTFDDAAPNIADPSNDGPASSWATGFLTRNPQPHRLVRVGGHGRQHNKQHKPAQPTRTFVDASSGQAGGLNPSMFVASPTTVNPWINPCYPLLVPPTPTLTWRIRRLEVVAGQAGSATPPNVQTITNITVLANGDAGIQCPATVELLNYTPSGNFAFFGWSVSACLIVLETQSFPGGAWKPDPTTFKLTQTCGDVT